MIKNDNKTTILLSSITLSLMLLLPSSAFALIPANCDGSTGNVAGSVSINPSNKALLSDPPEVFVTFTVMVPDIGDPPSCDAQIGPTFFGEGLITVNGFDVTGTADCPAPDGVDRIISNGGSLELWGNAGVYGTCKINSNLIEGSNLVFGFGNTAQFNTANDANPNFQAAVNSASKDIYSACIEVTKTGPAKVKLVDGSAMVEYTVNVENCADGVNPSPLDNCSIDDTIAGNGIPVPGTIAPGNDVDVMYSTSINGPTLNTATVTCDDQQDVQHSDFDDHMVDTYTAGITVMKMAPAKLAENENVVYDVWIQNDGSSTITDCVVEDLTLGQSDNEECTSIAAGDDCHVQFTGPICIEAPSINSVNVTCKDQEQEDVSGSADNTVQPLCASFSVDIQKVCDAKVVQVPDNPADPINCTITVENDGPGTLTNCVVMDSLSGVFPTGNNPLNGEFPSTLTPAQMVMVDTETTVTQQMIDDMIVTNDARIDCDTQDTFPPVFDEDSAEIEVFSVDATITKECTPETQTTPGTIDWEWWLDNTSPDGKSSLDAFCEGESTINPGVGNEIQDFFDDVITANSLTDPTHNMWTEIDLEPGIYSNEIICTFTAQNDLTFQRMASDSCEVEPDEAFAGCTPGGYKGNYQIRNDFPRWQDAQDPDFPSDSGEAWYEYDGTDVTPDRSFESVFGPATLNWSDKGKPQPINDATLLQALQANGGGENALARHCTAAFLNALNASNHPYNTYFLDVDEVVTACSEVFADGITTIDMTEYDVNSLKNLLAENNELGCFENAAGIPQEVIIEED